VIWFNALAESLLMGKIEAKVNMFEQTGIIFLSLKIPYKFLQYYYSIFFTICQQQLQYAVFFTR